MIYLLPSLLAIMQGYFLLTVLIPRNARPPMPLFIFLSSLLGMTTTALLTGSSLVLFSVILPAYTIGVNSAVTAGLFFLARRRGLTAPFGRKNWDRTDLIGLHLILLAYVPIVINAFRHPGKITASPHPLLFQLVNQWAWSFSRTHDQAVIIVTACRISLILTGILSFGIKLGWTYWSSRRCGPSTTRSRPS